MCFWCATKRLGSASAITIVAKDACTLPSTVRATCDVARAAARRIFLAPLPEIAFFKEALAVAAMSAQHMASKLVVSLSPPATEATPPRAAEPAEAISAWRGTGRKGS